MNLLVSVALRLLFVISSLLACSHETLATLTHNPSPTLISSCDFYLNLFSPPVLTAELEMPIARSPDVLETFVRGINERESSKTLVPTGFDFDLDQEISQTWTGAEGPRVLQELLPEGGRF